MPSIKNRQKKILDYMEKTNQSPLVFRGNYGKNSPVINITGYEPTDIDGIVMDILNKSQLHPSFNPKTGKFETSAGRLRSALDIWRHAKSILPDIDIFTVMESIYRIRNELYGHFCLTVRRTVFRPNLFYHGRIDDPSSFMCFEYGIKFSTWKNLHEPKRKAKPMV